MESIGKVVLVLPHPDDEVFCLHILHHFQGLQLSFIYLTNGCPANEMKCSHVREVESRNAIEILSKGAEIFNYGLTNGLTDGKLAREFSKDDLSRINYFIGQGPKPIAFISPLLEGGHQDHDAAFIIAENLSRSWKAEHYAFPLYSASRFSFPFFRTMKRSHGCISSRQTFSSRRNFVRKTIKLIQIYQSQKSTWLGLAVPVLFHYIFRDLTYSINVQRSIEQINSFLYESRGQETRETLRKFQHKFSSGA